MLASVFLPLVLLHAPSGTAPDDVGPLVEIVDPSVTVVSFDAPYAFTVTVEASDEESGIEEVTLRAASTQPP